MQPPAMARCALAERICLRCHLAWVCPPACCHVSHLQPLPLSSPGASAGPRRGPGVSAGPRCARLGPARPRRICRASRLGPAHGGMIFMSGRRSPCGQHVGHNLERSHKDKAMFMRDFVAAYSVARRQSWIAPWRSAIRWFLPKLPFEMRVAWRAMSDGFISSMACVLRGERTVPRKFYLAEVQAERRASEERQRALAARSVRPAPSPRPAPSLWDLYACYSSWCRLLRAGRPRGATAHVLRWLQAVAPAARARRMAASLRAIEALSS